MAQQAEISITENFENNLDSIRYYFHSQQQQNSYKKLLNKLFNHIIPNLQTHPMIGFDFLAQQVNSIGGDPFKAGSAVFSARYQIPNWKQFLEILFL